MIIDEVIAFKPIPVVKLSKDTDTPNNIKEVLLTLIFTSSFFLKSKSSFIKRIKKIIPSNFWELNINIDKNLVPIIRPNIGKKKWNIPTKIGKIVKDFLERLRVPRDKAKEKVSILRATAIVSNINSKKITLIIYIKMISKILIILKFSLVDMI